MKKIILLSLTLLLVLFSFGQSKIFLNDSTSSKGDSIIYANDKKWIPTSNNYDLNKVKYNLHCMHKEYMNGIKFQIGGIIASSLGIVAYNYGINNADNILNFSYREGNNLENIGIGLTILGSVSVISGTIMTIDSHKYLKKASIGYNITPTSTNIKVNF